MRAPFHGVTFDRLPRPLHWLCRGPPCPDQSVNEVEDPGEKAGAVWLEETLSVCEKLLIVRRWACTTHAGSGLCDCGTVDVLCVPFGVDQAVLYYWHCLWTSGRLPVVGGNFLEIGHP